MKTDVFEILKRASVFMILAQAIIHFRPSPVYEKYIRFLTGMMTAVILFLPMMEVFREGIGEDYWNTLAEYKEQIENVSLDNLSVRDTSGSTYLQTVEEEIRNTLNEALTDKNIRADRVELLGVVDGEEGKTGRSGIRIYIREGLDQDADDKIAVDIISIGEKYGEGNGSEDVRMREEIAEILQTDIDSVEVVILDGTS